MIKLYKYFIVILALYAVVLPVKAWDSTVKGNPEQVWNTPLGDSKLQINENNRCRLIAKVLPPPGAVDEARRNYHEILSEYISKLYAQAVKISAYIEEEKTSEASSAGLSDALKLQEAAAKYSGNIALRLNIINSMESGTTVLEALTALKALPNNLLSDYSEECSESTDGE